MYSSFINIMQDLDIDYQDEGPWRSYYLESYGDTFEEVWDNAVIEELDKDGGTLRCYHVMEAHGEVFNKAEKILQEKLYVFRKG